MHYEQAVGGEDVRAGNVRADHVRGRGRIYCILLLSQLVIFINFLESEAEAVIDDG